MGQGQGPSHFTASCLLLRHACCSSLHCTREHRLGDGGSALGPAASPEGSYHSRKEGRWVLCLLENTKQYQGRLRAAPRAMSFRWKPDLLDPFWQLPYPQGTLSSHVGYSFFRIPSCPPPFSPSRLPPNPSLLSPSSFFVSSTVPTRSLLPVLSPCPSPPHPVTTARNSTSTPYANPKALPRPG